MLNRVVPEIWKDVVGYEGLYQVSNYGKVRSLDREVFNGSGYYTKKGRILKKTKTTTGYWKVELYKSGKRKSKKVHRLVAKTFITRIDGKDLINHKDGNPLNNFVNNLEWCNQSENMNHAYETGLRYSNFTKFKKEITKEYLKNKGTNVKQLARKYKCSDASIRKHFKKNGIEIRGISQAQDKYKINRQKMITYFEEGLSNKEISDKFNANTNLISAYRHKHKKGELAV